jgi:hypothetical protein
MKRVYVILLFFLPLFGGFAQIPTNGLVAHYPFNCNANDASGNGNLWYNAYILVSTTPQKFIKNKGV